MRGFHLVNQRIFAALEKNDRRGERAIALFQVIFALFILALHSVSAFRNDWQTFSQTTVIISVLMLFSSALRVRFSKIIPLRNSLLHSLTVIDGILLFILMSSYSQAYDLPFETVFKTPSVIFLLAYTCVRVVRIDIWSIITAATTVFVGWFGLLILSILNGAQTTTSYVEYVSSSKLLIGANIEFAFGYLTIVAALCLVVVYARRLLTNSAHANDLTEAIIVSHNNLSRMRSILKSTSDGVVIVDKYGTIEQVNPALEKLFGYDTDELQGQNVAALMSVDNAELLKKGIELYIVTGQSHLVGQPFETLAIRKGGTSFPIEVAISNFDSGDSPSFAGFIRDIGDRKLAQAREKNALAQFEDAVQSALDAIIIIDTHDRIISFNPAAENIFGYKASEAVGKKMGNLIIPEKYRVAHLAGMQHFLNTGEGPVLGNRIEIEGLRKSGEEFDLELAVRDIKSPLGKLFIGYARDITARKASEQELVAAKENAEIATSAKASFLAMMSHEIRTPLNGVLGVLELLKDSEISTEQSEQIEVANRSGMSLMKIINDILDFSKLDVGKLELNPKSFEIETLITSITSLAKASAYKKNVEFIVHIEKSVPKILLGDNDRIGQILLNLLSNAIKFTNSGSVELLVSNLKTNTNPEIRFKIKDTGLGIPADKHDQLFADFTTIDADYTSKFGGTGLGLSICKALVELMDGKINFTSEYGLGSEFWIDLPLEVGRQEDLTISPEINAQIAGIEHRPLRVLLAEDNSANQMIVSVMLKRMGFETDIVANGFEAVKAVKERHYDIVLMDISMPDMDGLEATRQIRSLPNDRAFTKIIALTAYAREEDKLKVKNAGMDSFLSKPVFRKDLIEAIDNLLNEKDDHQKQNIDARIETKNIFDPDTLNSVLDGMEGDVIKMLFSKFINDLVKHQKNTEAALKSGDGESLERASHGLKGLSSTFGATHLYALSSKVNDQCNNV